MTDTKTAEEFLKRLKKIPLIIENCELQKRSWEERAKNTTSGGVSVCIPNRKTGELEPHNIEKVQSSSGGESMAVAVASYVDLERKIEALKTEKKKAEAIIEQLEPTLYDVIYKFYIMGWKIYEIALNYKKSDSHIKSLKKIALQKLQILLDDSQNSTK